MATSLPAVHTIITPTTNTQLDEARGLPPRAVSTHDEQRLALLR
jgi:hypothetical protein